MLRVLKKLVVSMIDWLLYKVLNTKQKQALSGLFTQKQKQMLKNIIKPGKKQSQLRKIERVKHRLYTLGFVHRGLSELKELFQESDDAYLRKLAAWELATWHANQYSPNDAKECLTYLETALASEKDKELLRRAAVLQAECYDILNEREKGKKIVQKALMEGAHPDLYLAAANLEESLTDRLNWINKVFDIGQTAPIEVVPNNDRSAYDSITSIPKTSTEQQEQTHKVTVIIPAYNAEEMIQTSLDSILMQTWRNLEVFVIDDCSYDQTVAVVKEYVQKDNRVQFIQTERNGGAYVARNHALAKATGDFVTINDADDWSHPEKLEIQVRHLIDNPKIIANFSNQVRATNELKFYRRGKPGIFIFTNMSSFMFRREPAFENIGFWDCVRFGGDSEFVKRIKVIFGEKSVVELQTAPLSFQRQSESSLTSHSAFGFPGYFMGARQEYKEAHEQYHRTYPTKLKYTFPQGLRPFPVPEPMWPTRAEKTDGRRHFDVIIVSEFRLLGGTNMSNVEEIKAQKRFGLRTGLVQMSRYDLNSVDKINPKVRELLDGDRVQMIVYGENVSCDVLIVRHPPILQEWQQYIPNIEAKSVQVIVNQPPKRDYSKDGETLYEIPRCVEQLKQYIGSAGTWYPIGPLIRDTLFEHHREELKSIELSTDDWVNIIDVDEWKRPSRPTKGNTIKIGRHSRDQYVKWPNQKEELEAVYPSKEPYEVYVLGGANAPKKVLGQLPKNWTVTDFGKEDPKTFLARLDVFVYYTHPDWVEAFGRVIFEAMAVGVPVIIPPHYEQLFGDAAIYATSNEVQEKINQLMSDDTAYQQQVERAHAYVEKEFGYSKHASRLEKFLNGR